MGLQLQRSASSCLRRNSRFWIKTAPTKGRGDVSITKSARVLKPRPTIAGSGRLAAPLSTEHRGVQHERSGNFYRGMAVAEFFGGLKKGADQEKGVSQYPGFARADVLVYVEVLCNRSRRAQQSEGAAAEVFEKASQRNSGVSEYCGRSTQACYPMQLWSALPRAALARRRDVNGSHLTRCPGPRSQASGWRVKPIRG